jgi:protein-disulfide isomerase
MSGKQERERRQQERVQAETKVDTQDRRKKLLQIGAGAAFLAVAVVVVLIVIASSGSDGGEAENIVDASVVAEELGGLEQNGLVLGDPNAPVELIEFGDLQCPVCKGVSEEALPAIFAGAVAKGEAKIAFRNFIVISEQSEPAGAAAIAAGKQGRGWNFVELFYRNQGREGSGYVTDEFLTAIAEGAGVPDIAKWNQDRKSAAAKNEVRKTDEEASRIGFEGTPSFAVKGPGAQGMEALGGLQTTEQIEDAIAGAAG